MESEVIKKCRLIFKLYKSGELGQTVMPEDASPAFSDVENEMRLAYFTLPMTLNYQRDSYKLWEAALKTYNDPETRFVFDIGKVTSADEQKVRIALLKYKVALQPNKHVTTWRTISKTVFENFGTFENLIKQSDNDFAKLKKIITNDYKKSFPYLSGPKIFNYWSFIITTYGKTKLSNRDMIEIAPDTHITQCSVKLGVITEQEAETLSKDEISARWRELLADSGIDPIDMHSPLWFWSRNGFLKEP